MTSESIRRDASTISSELLREVREGDDLAWRRMVNLYGPLVYHWSRSAGLQPADATEVTQEVFCSVLASVETFERSKQNHSFRGWLRTITRHKVADFGIAFDRIQGSDAGNRVWVGQLKPHKRRADEPPDTAVGLELLETVIRNLAKGFTR